MAVLKVKDPAGNWVDITGTGQQGPSGGPVPVGGAVNEVIVKTGPADFEVAWRSGHGWRSTTDRLVRIDPAMTDMFSVDATFYPDRMYHIFAGWRCIQSSGSTARVEMQVAIGTVNLTGHDVRSPTTRTSCGGA